MSGATPDIGTCDVTRAFHSFGRTLNSLAVPLKDNISALKTTSSSWEMLRQKGHIVSQNGTTALLYIPRHLLGLEAAISILEAGVHGMSSGAECPKPRFDLAIRAEADLQADTLLTATGHHHSIADTSGIAVPGSPLGPRRPVPYYLAANRRLLKPVAKGELIRCGDIEIAEDSHLAKLRCKQDQMFFGQEAFAS